ncbi:MAG: hypothetical protein ACREKK_14280, partial [Candidatus Methylomirabilales bacterium]
MKRQPIKVIPFGWTRALAAFPLQAALLAALLLVSFACKGGRSPNSQNAAPHLEDRNAQGEYRPYIQTGGLSDPRYWHQA